jgi:nucleotide-binding universal stress UspA family protein
MTVQLTPTTAPATSPPAPRTIVTGYDGSAEARHALTVAADRAGPGGTVVVVHATPPASAWLDSPFYDDAVAARMRQEREIRRDLRSVDFGDVHAEIETVAGPAAAAIMQAARSRDAAEIVVGSRGLGTVRALLGSVSQDLVRRADRPVVIVPPDAASAASEGVGRTGRPVSAVSEAT